MYNRRTTRTFQITQVEKGMHVKGGGKIGIGVGNCPITECLQQIGIMTLTKGAGRLNVQIERNLSLGYLIILLLLFLNQFRNEISVVDY